MSPAKRRATRRARPAPRRRATGELGAVELMALADQARRPAHAPYSRFRVGAALLAGDGRVFLGCNVENASFGLSVCAERVALWKAVSEGVRDFRAVAVTAGPGESASPCGACRQVLHEFAPGLVIFWKDGDRPMRNRLSELLDHAFDLEPKKKRKQ